MQELQVKDQCQNKRLNKKINTFKEKKVHSQYFATIDELHIDKKSNLTWLKS